MTQTDEEKARECIFCGEQMKPQAWVCDDMGWSAHLQCGVCDAHGPTSDAWYETRAEAEENATAMWDEGITAARAEGRRQGMGEAAGVIEAAKFYAMTMMDPTLSHEREEAADDLLKALSAIEAKAKEAQNG